MAPQHNKTLITGILSRETLINRNGDVFVDHPGGNLLYTAFAYQLFGNDAGLAASISEDYPQDWVDAIRGKGFNVSGIHRRPFVFDDREFFALPASGEKHKQNPQYFFAEAQLPFPKNLLGYQSSSLSEVDKKDSGSSFSLKPDDLPDECFDVNFLYLGPIDYFTHNLFTTYYRSNHRGNIIINPSEGYMQPSWFYDLPPLFRGNLAVVTTEKKIKRLFAGRSEDLWEMAAHLGSMGVEIVVITNGENGQLVLNQSAHLKYEIPAYPVPCIVDDIGVNEAFAGGFLAGFIKYFDPLQAALIGNITASAKVEGSKPDYLLEALPDLLEARLEVIRERIKQI
jgi:hypothetical protein